MADIRPALSYDTDCSLTKRWRIQPLNVADMWMLWWICAYTRIC
uniref:Uncharacterized protein n=1 Tax=Arundo donax TaxID=35708 RepID=A0A0A8Y501_ARUDO